MHDFGMPLAQIFARGHQEAARAAGRVADDVLGLRRGHLHHEPDDVTRRAELAVLPGAGNLAEHVFVEVALGVPVFHRDLVEHVHDLGQQRGRGNGEARVLHVLGVGRAIAAQSAQEGKDVLADHRDTSRAASRVLEAGPAEVLDKTASCCPCLLGRTAAPSASFQPVGLRSPRRCPARPGA